MPKRLCGIVWWICFIAAPLLLTLGIFGQLRLFILAAEQKGPDQSDLVNTLLLALLPVLLMAFFASAFIVDYLRGRALKRQENRETSTRLRQNYHQDFVRLIADNRPGATMIIDGAGRLWFANAEATRRQAIAANEVVGMQFVHVFSETDVLRLMPLIRQARQDKKVVEQVNLVKSAGETRYIKSQIIPLTEAANMNDAVMVNEDDMTSLLVEREARERMFRQLIDTLVAVVDRRDPYATGHSVRVGQLARAIAEQMNLEDCSLETAEIAGLLMNFGKVLVPRAILVKTSALSPDELKQVHDSMLASADILSLIGFAQPVVPTLRHVLEHFDGSGLPQGLKGDAIMLTARIVTVANAFVALLSARAHRPSLGIQGALDNISARSGKTYDPSVVTALAATLRTGKNNLAWLNLV